MPVCNDVKCRATLLWKKPYKKGDRPVNPDGTSHHCKYKGFRPVKKWEHIHCKLCPAIINDKRQEGSYNIHMKNYHPNGEYLTEWDMKTESSNPVFRKLYMRYWYDKDGKRYV